MAKIETTKDGLLLTAKAGDLRAAELTRQMLKLVAIVDDSSAVDANRFERILSRFDTNGVYQNGPEDDSN